MARPEELDKDILKNLRAAHHTPAGLARLIGHTHSRRRERIEGDHVVGASYVTVGTRE